MSWPLFVSFASVQEPKLPGLSSACAYLAKACCKLTLARAIALGEAGVFMMALSITKSRMGILSAHTPTIKPDGAACLRNLITATMASTTKSAITTSCVSKNGGSDCVGAIDFKAGTFWKACTIPTKTLR